MSSESAALTERQETGRTDPTEVLKRLAKLGDMEVVTAASGDVLYIAQSPDD